MIKKIDNYFVIETNNTTYCFMVSETGHLFHLYYGKKISEKEIFELKWNTKQTGNTVYYSKDFPYSFEDIKMEFGFPGKGDIRESLIEVTNSDGSFTVDFKYDHYEILDYKKELEGLPSSYDGNNELVIYLRDYKHNYLLELNYSIFDEDDVITKSVKFINESTNTIKLNKLLSNSIDFDENFTVTSFVGNWANEMNKVTTKVSGGKYVIESTIGSSSSRANSFFMLSKDDTLENSGKCLGFNLVYSGNHYGSISTTALNTTRVVQGINPYMFEFEIEPNESFVAPEAIVCYSEDGFNGLSKRLHGFINNHIVNKNYAGKDRPVLLNSWEANYFDISEDKLVQLAKKAKEVGIEMLVMDDGWFGNRNDDTSSLGDWYVNKDKLPNGLEGLANKIHDIGLKFGIWVEMEMVSVDSEFYRNHPDWVMSIDEDTHSEGRNQRILDLCNPMVRKYIYDSLDNMLGSGLIDYVKWDYNRIFSDVYSPTLKTRQKETFHRYILGLYRIMKKVTSKYPNVLFEGCGAGGNRFDLGILSYFPQIWGSDNTDAITRFDIQNNYSYGYPLSCFTNHVSAVPNHQTGRTTNLTTRFNVASFGNLGYELDLIKVSGQELEEIRKQVELYKQHRHFFQYGTFEREVDDKYYYWKLKDGNIQRSCRFVKKIFENR